jgi:integrase/recombinase XerD
VEPNLRFISSFLDYLKVEKGLAALTVSAYQSDLAQYSDFLKKRKRALRDARRQDVRDFLNALLSNGVDGRSVARKLSMLRHFYKYLLLDRYIEGDPTLNIDSPKQWKVLPKSLAADEVESVLQGPPRAKDDRLSQALTVRDRAMLEVFYAGALRVSEVINVKLEDLKLDMGYMLVRGKGDKERIVPLGRAAQSASLASVFGSWSMQPQRRRGGMPARTCCGIVVRHTWWRTEPTCAPCRRFWGTQTSRQRRCTRIWRLIA